MNDEENGVAKSLGLLGRYGVLVIPAPKRVPDEVADLQQEDGAGEWFVGLARWSDQVEGYSASTDGPMFDTREEAMAEANRVLDWLAAQPADADVLRLWAGIQQFGPDSALNDLPSTSAAWGGMRT